MKDLRNYALVTAAYWGFTLTDGAPRMLCCCVSSRWEMATSHRLPFSLL